MTIPGLNESLIRQNASAESFRRGQEYRRWEAVLGLTQGDGVLEAQVKSSGAESYHVHIIFDQDGISHAECSCPYSWGGWCKHIVAALLTYLSPLERATCRRTNLDAWQKEQFESVRHQVIDILHSLDGMRRSQAYWYVERVVDRVRGLLHEVDVLLIDGEWEKALVILEATTVAYISDWTCLDDSDGFAGAFFADLDRVWTNALSMVDLAPAERAKWRKKLKRWQDEVSLYGIADVFGAILGS